MIALLTDDKLTLMKISRLYYYDNLTQAEIAKIIGVSRPLIIKALQKARDEGLVKIRIKDEGFHTLELEVQMKEWFHLDNVIIVPTTGMPADQADAALYRSAAFHVSLLIKNLRTVGVSWGSALYHMAAEFPKLNYDRLQLLPLLGGVGAYRFELHANQIAFALSKQLNCTCIPLNAPAVAETEEHWQQLLQTPSLAEYMDALTKVDAAIIGIGNNPLSESSSIQEMGYMGDKEKTELARLHVVGNTGGIFFDQDGRMVPNSISSRVIGIDLEGLKAINKVVAIAKGPDKIASIAGALRGGFINVFITDDRTAERVIAHADAKEGQHAGR